MPDAERFYTTKTGAPLLGIKQDTLKIYAIQSGIGHQPGGPGTAYVFTHDELLEIREWQKGKQRGRWSKTQIAEDREELGVGPMYGPKGKPGR